MGWTRTSRRPWRAAGPPSRSPTGSSRRTPATPTTPWSSSCATALHWGDDEDRHPSRVRRGPRALHVRQRIHDALDHARDPRGDLLELPSVLHGQAEAGRHRRARGALQAPRRPASALELPHRYTVPTARSRVARSRAGREPALVREASWRDARFAPPRQWLRRAPSRWPAPP